MVSLDNESFVAVIDCSQKSQWFVKKRLSADWSEKLTCNFFTSGPSASGQHVGQEEGEGRVDVLQLFRLDLFGVLDVFRTVLLIEFFLMDLFEVGHFAALKKELNYVFACSKQSRYFWTIGEIIYSLNYLYQKVQWMNCTYSKLT